MPTIFGRKQSESHPVRVILRRFKNQALKFKSELLALWFACKHPQTPLAAKLMAAVVAAYAFSPIDLIPDFIPVLGYLDDLILLPLGVWIVLMLIPDTVMAQCREQARAWLAHRNQKPRNHIAASIIILVWLVALWLIWLWFAEWWSAR